MQKESLGVRDQVIQSVGFNRGPQDGVGVKGMITVELFGPDGKLKYRSENHNLVTDKGDAHWAAVAYGTALGTLGMKLGTASTATSKTYNNAGAYVAVADYVSGSAAAMVDSYPKVGTSPNIAQYQSTWAAGVATNSTINRVSLCDNTTDAGETDGTHTWAIALMAPAPVAKGASDTLTITWLITFLGA